VKRVDDPEESSRTTADEFDGDPSVRKMRRVFSALEAAQKEFIMELGLSPFGSQTAAVAREDPCRLRSVLGSKCDEGVSN